jgi:hypothetical protein
VGRVEVGRFGQTAGVAVDQVGQHGDHAARGHRRAAHVIVGCRGALEAAAWMLLSVLSARPWRAAVMPGPGRLEGDVAELALHALVPPGGSLP